MFVCGYVCGWTGSCRTCLYLQLHVRHGVDVAQPPDPADDSCGAGARRAIRPSQTVHGCTFARPSVSLHPRRMEEIEHVNHLASGASLRMAVGWRGLAGGHTEFRHAIAQLSHPRASNAFVWHASQQDVCDLPRRLSHHLHPHCQHAARRLGEQDSGTPVLCARVTPPCG